MFFHDIGIYLHFLFEGDITSPHVSQIFNNYHHAARQYRPGTNTVVAAFLLKEVNRLLPSYHSSAQGESIVMTAEHTCESRRFIVRVWRNRSLLDRTWDQEALEDDQVIIRAFRGGSPGQNAEVLSETLPELFPAKQPFTWFDAGVIYEVPGCDISVTVTRPSTQQTCTAIFKFVKSDSFAPQFPGVPISSTEVNTTYDPHCVVADSDDERRLNQFIQAFIEKTRLDEVPVPAGMSSNATQTSEPQANDHYTSEETAPRAFKNGSPALTERCVDPGDTFLCRAFNASSPAPSEAHTVQGADKGKETVNISSTSSTALEVRSPLLTHRAWAALSNLTSAITSSRAASERSRASSVAPINSMITEPQAEPETARTQFTETRASSPCASENDETVHENLATLLTDITSIIDDASCGLEENHWADAAVQTDSEDSGSEKEDMKTETGINTNDGGRVNGSASMMVRQETHVEQADGQPKVVGVSCPAQANAGTSGENGGDAMQVCQPLKLPVGANRAQGAISAIGNGIAAGNAPSSDPAASTNTTGQPAAGTERVDSDIEMTDVHTQARDISPNGTHTQATNCDGNPAAAAAQQIAQSETTQARNEASVDANKENEQPGQVTGDDEVQFVSCSRAEEQNGAFIETGLRQQSMVDRSMSEMPLAELLSGMRHNLNDETASALGTIIRSGASAYGGGSMLGRASPAPSTASHSSFRPSAQQVSQYLEYLHALLVKDKEHDDSRCRQLTAQKEQYTQEFDEAKAAYQMKLSENHIQLSTARSKQALKKDTIRFLRATFKLQNRVAGSRSKTKTGAGSRIGSDHSRGRSMSRAPSVARSSRTPSVVPASRIKRERIDLTGDEVLAPRSRAVSLAPSVQRGMSTVRNFGTGRSENGVKVGDLHDLLRPLPVQHKRSGSHAGLVRGATPRAGTLAANAGVDQWLNHTRAGRAGTSASTVARSVIDSTLMPPPRLPIAPGALPSSLIVIDGNTSNTNPRPRGTSSSAQSTVGLSRSIRAGSVASNVSRRSASRHPSVAPSAGQRAHQVVDDSDDEDDALFLGSRSRATSVTSQFTELHD